MTTLVTCSSEWGDGTWEGPLKAPYGPDGNVVGGAEGHTVLTELQDSSIIHHCADIVRGLVRGQEEKPVWSGLIHGEGSACPGSLLLPMSLEMKRLRSY